MERYFFDLHDEDGVLTDEEGLELDGPQSVRAAAIREARALMSHDVGVGSLDLDARIVVKDAAGAVVLALPFREALEP